MTYTIVIRTLGTAGEYYQRTLDSIQRQTIQPEAVLVYIAEGYPIPKETIGIEQYIYVKKGMVAQRALRYEEVQTDYMLFLDDDVYLPEDGMETLYREMVEHGGQVIAPCVFPNHQVTWKAKVRLSLLGREVARLGDGRWGYRVLRTGGFSYHNNPTKGVYESTTNAGPCFFCEKEAFLSAHFEEELWLDSAPYAFPEDQVLFYKMHLAGAKVLTSFDSGIVHLDAGSSTQGSEEKCLKVIYSEYRNKIIFWHKFIYSQEKGIFARCWSGICLGYALGMQYLNNGYKSLRGEKKQAEAFRQGVRDGMNYIKTLNQ